MSTLLINDNFNRANSGTVGNGWTGSAQYSISSNKLLVTGNSAQVFLTQPSSANSAQAHGSVTSDAITIGELLFGLAFRTVDTSSNFYVLAAYRQGTGANWQLQLKRGGTTFTSLQKLPFTSGHAYRVDATIFGIGANVLLTVAITDTTTNVTYTSSWIDTAAPAGMQGASAVGIVAYTSTGQSFSITNATIYNDDAIQVDPAYLASGTSGDTVALTDQSAAWTAGTPGTPTFGESSTGSGSSITAQTVNSAVKATLTVTAGTAGTITYTDPGRSVTATESVAALPTATGEVQFNGTAFGTPGSYLGGTFAMVSASGQTWAGSYGDYTKCFDGDFTTGYMAADPSNNYVGIDCGAAVTLTRMRLAPMNGYEVQVPGAALQGSTAGPTGPWTTIYTISTPGYPVRGRWNEYALSPGTRYRWYRLLSATGGQVAISELRLFGNPDTAATYQPIPPTFSPNGGRYPCGVRVRLASLTTGTATHYYTTDGTTPVVTGGVPQGTTQRYTQPILVTTNGAVLKAITVADGNSSDVSTSAAYTTNGVNYLSPMQIKDDRGITAQIYSPWVQWDPTAKKYWILGMLADADNFSTSDINHELQSTVLYSSVDLVNVTYEGTIIGSDGSTFAGMWRPKMLWNAANSIWVLWSETSTFQTAGGSGAGAGIWTASTPKGPWTQKQINYNPDAKGFKDFTLYQEGANAWLIRTVSVDGGVSGNSDIWITPLAADYQSVTGTATDIVAGTGREAPVLFKNGSTYYLLTSVGNYYDSSSLFSVHYHTAAAVTGPYTDQGIPFPSDPTTGSFNSQPACIVPIQGRAAGSYLYLADHWIQLPLKSSTQSWQPVTTASGTTLSIALNGNWKLDDVFATSTGPGAATGLSASVASGNINLTWTNTDTTGALLAIDRATDSGFTSNVVTDLQSATSTSYTDSQATPGTQYYYRVRTYSAAGTSLSSSANGTVPLGVGVFSQSMVNGVTLQHKGQSLTLNSGSVRSQGNSATGTGGTFRQTYQSVTGTAGVTTDEEV